MLEPPDRSQLREMFRRYEFRALLNRIEDLEDAIPSAVPVPVAGAVVPWREGELPQVRGRAGIAIADGRFALAQEDGVIVGAVGREPAAASSARLSSSRTTTRRCPG